MANAFSPGRVSLWHTNPTGLNLDYTKAKDLGVTDVMIPAHLATKAKMDEVRAKPAADGKNMRAQLSVDGTHGQKGDELASFTLERITALKPGVVEVNVEGPEDNAIGVCIQLFHQTFRAAGDWQARFPVCFNIVPMKGYVLPVLDLAENENTYVRVQRFYGAEMRPAEPTLCREDVAGRGFPAERFSFMESAKARRQIDGSLFIDLPVFSDGGVRVRNLSGGAIFNANLLREAGLV